MNIFEKYDYDINIKLNNFEKFVRGQSLTRFIARYELFKRILTTTGAVIECGVHNGGGLFAWAKLSNALEPYNTKRKIIGFDSFEGFPDISENDKIAEKDNKEIKAGGFKSENNIYEEILELKGKFENEKTIQGYDKIKVIKGDANYTMPDYIKNNPETLVSLVYLDFDIYKPTITAIDTFLPRICKGGIIAFDEVNDAKWPGETMALLEKLNLNKHKLESFELYPQMSFITI